MFLELVLAVWAFSLPMDLFRVRLPFWPGRPARALVAAPRRARLAEHDWEERVLRNLTSVE